MSYMCDGVLQDLTYRTRRMSPISWTDVMDWPSSVVRGPILFFIFYFVFAKIKKCLLLFFIEVMALPSTSLFFFSLESPLSMLPRPISPFWHLLFALGITGFLVVCRLRSLLWFFSS